MDATVKGSFWTDSRMEELPAAEKLCALWLITNPTRTLLGFTHTTARRFLLDTNLDLGKLEGVCKALPSSFQALPGGWYFARNFLRHQFGGKGGQVSHNNKVIIAAIRQAKALPSPLQAAFLAAYPELTERVKKEDPKRSPSQGAPHGVTTTTTETTTETAGKGDTGETQLETIVAAYPRREDTAACLQLVARHIDAGHDPAAILAGTRAIATAIAALPSGPRNAFVLSATRFFRDQRWRDDPATWLRQADKAATTKPARGAKLTPEERARRLGGRGTDPDASAA